MQFWKFILQFWKISAKFRQISIYNLERIVFILRFNTYNLLMIYSITGNLLFIVSVFIGSLQTNVYKFNYTGERSMS